MHAIHSALRRVVRTNVLAIAALKSLRTSGSRQIESAYITTLVISRKGLLGGNIVLLQNGDNPIFDLYVCAQMCFIFFAIVIIAFIAPIFSFSA